MVRVQYGYDLPVLFVVVNSYRALQDCGKVSDECEMTDICLTKSFCTIDYTLACGYPKTHFTCTCPLNSRNVTLNNG